MAGEDTRKPPGPVKPAGRTAPPPDQNDSPDATAMLSPEVLAKVRTGIEEVEERTQIAQEALETARFDAPVRREEPRRSAPPLDEVDERTQMAEALEDRPIPRGAARSTDLGHGRPAAAAPRPAHDPHPARATGSARANAPPTEERTQIAQESAPPVRPAAQPKAVLTVLMGPDEGRRYLIGDGVSHVGRALDCEVVLNDPSSSRKHFRIEAAAGRFVLIDLGSENGTCVGGTRVKKAVLEQDDQVSVGTTLLHFGHVGAPGPTLAAEAPAAARSRTPKKSGGRPGWVVPAFASIGALAVGAGVVFTGQGLGWWNLFGSSSPQPVVAAADPAPGTPDGAAVDENADSAPPADGTGDSGSAEGSDSGSEGTTAQDGTEAAVVVPVAEAPDAGSPPEADIGAQVVADAGIAAEQDVPVVDAVTPSEDGVMAAAPGAEDTAGSETTELALAVPDSAVAAVEDVSTGDVLAVEDAVALATATDAEIAPPEVAVAVLAPDAAAAEGVDAGVVAVLAADAGVAAPPEAKDAQALLLEARLLVGEKKLAEAQLKLGEASKAGAPLDAVKTLAMTIGSASGHKLIFESQTRALAAKNYALVATLSAQIPADSPYAAESQAVVQQARDAQKPVDPGTPLVPKAPDLPLGPDATPEQKLLESVKTLGQTFLEHVLQKRDDKARELLLAPEDCGRASPTYAEECKKDVEAMRAGFDQLRKDLKGTTLVEVSDPDKLIGGEEWGALTVFAVEASVAFQPQPIATTVTVIQFGPEAFKVSFPVQVPTEEPVKPGPSTSLDRVRGLRFYTSGDFNGAAGYFLRASKDETLSEEDRDRAKGLVRNIQNFAKQYAAGTAAATQFRDIPAITALDEALALDRRIASGYQAKIKATLADVHAHRAGSQFQSGRFWEAAKAARKALQFDRANAGAKQVLDRLGAQADGLIQKAKAAESGGRADEAQRLLREAKLIVAPNDPRAAQIQKAIDRLSP